MMKLSIIIPVYNEEDTLRELIEGVEKVILNGIQKEIIIVDDKSCDSTKLIIEKELGKDIVKVYHSLNEGKGTAIRTALKHVSGDMILIQDGDLEYNPEDYTKLIKPILEDNIDVVYGSRFKNGNTHLNLFYYLANRFLTALTNLCYGSMLTDMETCYKLFRKEVLFSLNLESKGFEFEPEVTAKILRRGYRIQEVPIDYYARSRSRGKKIQFKDGLKAIYVLFKYTIGHKNSIKR